MENSNHVWQFSRVGGVNRVNLDSGKDLLALESLDQKLWTALSCPVNGLEIDYKTLELMDSDKDGKIRVLEILEAVKWITSLIKNPDELLQKRRSLPLSSINDSNELGAKLLASAKEILRNLNKPDATELAIEETSDIHAIFANTKFNGDGVITEDSTDDEILKKCINDIILCCGSSTDRNGKEGINQGILDAFITSGEEYLNWHSRAEFSKKDIFPFEEKTEEIYACISVLKPKIDDYFLRCHLAEFDPNSAEVLNSLSARMELIKDMDIADCIQEIEQFPIAKIIANQPLWFNAALNPAWKNRILKLKELVFDSKNIKKETLSETDWLDLCAKFDAYKLWISEKPQTSVEQLGIESIHQIISSDFRSKITDLLQQDVFIKEEADNIILVDKLVRYYADIYTLLRNFVTFSDFYMPKSKAIFQAGSLYFDQRSCDLCIRVSDLAKHNSMAAASGICLVYFDCFSKVKNEKMTIVAAFTDGDVDNLVMGRNALFYDNNGLDWDATIVKIIDNPISIRQAFWMPYRKVSKFISKQIEKFASTKDQEVHAVTTSKVESTTAKADTQLKETIKSHSIEVTGEKPNVIPAEPAKPAPFDIAKFAGIFAAIGLAFGAIGSVLASIVGGFLALTWWKMPLAFLGIILAISGPSMILAWLKLRKRNLAPVLDANGWAINAKATINIAFGASLTHLAKLPKNAKLNFNDPFTNKKNPLIPIVIILIVLCATAYWLWHCGYMAKWGILGV